MPKNFAQKHHFILEEFLRFQGTFPEKSFVSGFGAEAPTDNEHKKRGNAAFLFCQSMLELRSKPPSLTFLSEKSKQKNSVPNTSLYFGEAFEVPKDFLQKVLWSGSHGGSPQSTMLIHPFYPRRNKKATFVIL